MLNYKGIFYEGNNNKTKFYEGGAHFKYNDLYNKLSELQNMISPNKVENENYIELKGKKYKINNLSIKKNNLDNSFKSLHSKINNNIFSIKKNILKNELKFNKIKNIINNNINNKIIINEENNEKKEDIIKEENNYFFDNNNNNDKQIIKLKLKKLQNLKLYKRNNKYINFKKTNYSLPKIDSIYYRYLSGENKDNNKSNLSDITDNKSNINNKYNVNYLNINSNNLEEKKDILTNLSNKGNNININYNIMSEDNIHWLESKKNDIDSSNKLIDEKFINNDNSPLSIKIKKINSFNDFKNIKLIGSFNKIKKNKIFDKKIRNKKTINLYINTFKKYYSLKNKNLSYRDKNFEIKKYQNKNY